MIKTEIKAIEFIKSTLKNFIQKFPQTRVRYEYNAAAVVHTIEVVPNDIYRLNEHYIAWENDFTDEFITQFPDQNIGFISDDALVGLDSVDFELRGINYPCVLNEPVITMSLNPFSIGEVNFSKNIFNSSQITSINFDTTKAESANTASPSDGVLCVDQLFGNHYPAAA